MADDLNQVMMKMMDRTAGQGGPGYRKITLSNHLDYEKWNSHQIFESTEGVFRKMGEAFGLQSLFTYTHLFFRASWIYYNDRGDAIGVNDNEIINLTNSFAGMVKKEA